MAKKLSALKKLIAEKTAYTYHEHAASVKSTSKNSYEPNGSGGMESPQGRVDPHEQLQLHCVIALISYLKFLASGKIFCSFS